MPKSALALLMTIPLATCTGKEVGSNDDVGGTDSESGPNMASTAEAGDGDGDGGGTGTDETTGGNFECLDENYVPFPSPTETIDWLNASGIIDHRVSYDQLGSSQAIDATFHLTTLADEALLCVEIIVDPAGLDSCSVWYTQGQGLGGDQVQFEDLPANTVSFDLGNGPVMLAVSPGDNLNPTWYGIDLPAPPGGVPFAGVGTLNASFDGLDPLAVELDIPNDVMPISHAIDVTTLSSAELASWTWATPGGAEPVELDVTLGASPAGTGWSEWVQITCTVADDGAFEFPTEYLDLARARLGPELYASVRITRAQTGTVPFANEDLHWRSSVAASMRVAVVD